MSTTQNTHNGGISTAAVNQANSALSYAQRSLNRVVPPSTRQRVYEDVSAYAHARPILFTFLLTQCILCTLPLLTFLTFTLCTLAFTLGLAILFSLFWIGLAFMLLIPTLLVTSSIAVLVWAWAVGSFVVARAVWRRVPVGVKGDVVLDTGGRRFELKKGEKGFDGAFNE